MKVLKATKINYLKGFGNLKSMIMHLINFRNSRILLGLKAVMRMMKGKKTNLENFVLTSAKIIEVKFQLPIKF